MPNTSTPRSARYTGLFKDMVNGLVELYYNGTVVKQWSASAETTPAGVTETHGGTVNFDGAVDFDSTIDLGSSAITPNVRIMEADLGSTAAIASNGAGAILPDVKFVAPQNLRIVSAWKENQTASDVTAGTSISSASYRRFILVTNTAGTGSGTDIVASLNATASAASNFTRAFTSVASTVPAGAIVMMSHLTVGAETADGTDAAAGIFRMAYQYV